MSEINWGNYTEAYKAIHDAIHGIQTPHNVTITRNNEGYITQLQVTDGTVTKTVTITRNSANFIEQISENIE
ncbi:MAG: hypothetical protein CW691_07340 [Candidatus Bathyarchaeum sp.]|nr:MAG: hypothetical protein CW691_07340 [Candidatus Bathyarchaeum sp.]